MKKASAEKFLLAFATGDIDEDEGMTKREILGLLAVELGYTLVKIKEQHD